MNMKNRILKLTAFLLSLLMLCACHLPTAPVPEPVTTDTADEEGQPTKENNTVPDVEPETPAESESSVPEEKLDYDPALLSDWELAYLEHIESRGGKKEGAFICYALVYVDADEIPELYMRGCCEAEGDRICSYKNGRVVEVYLNRCGGGKYIERGGLLINQNGHMGRSYTSIYSLTEDGFTLLLSGREDETFVSTGEDFDDYQCFYEYVLEGNVVSEAEYNAAINAKIDLDQTVSFDRDAVSYEGIREQLIGRQPMDGKG